MSSRYTRSSLRRSRSAFTLVELSIALTLFTVLGYGLSLAMQSGGSASSTVSRMTAENGDLRELRNRLAGELEFARDGDIAVTVLADGNHQLNFMVPIDDGAGPDWGVYDTSLGLDTASQNRVDWRFQYTVQVRPLGGGALDRTLVRQIIDDTGVVQREEVLVGGLRSGTDNPPGFSITQAGDLWEVTVSTKRTDGNQGGRRVVFHVHTRN